MTTDKPEAAQMVGARAEFEAWITSPPYEKPVTINKDSSGWPGEYRAYEVQLAWEAYQAARAQATAAPGVQGEPVAYISHTSEGDILGWERQFDAPSHTPLYTAPKPAAQQQPADGSLTPVPDEPFAAEFNSWWEQHGQFCRAGGGDYERTFAFESWRHLYPKLMKLQKVAVEQQTAPDVAKLVEALEDIAGTHHHSASAGEYFAKVARKALAAHCNLGGEA